MAAVQDLPDPLEKPAATPASQSPDDLLSQMADDAIDKLIAEAETQSAVLPAPPPAPAVPSADVSAESLIDNLLQETETAESPVEAATFQSVLTTADASPAPHVQPAPPPADNSHPAPPPPELSTSADIKALLADSGPAPQGEEGASPLLMPLRLLSAPLTHADDYIRNAVGQIAILTLLNAIAVLIYVLVVRHK